MIYLLDKLFNRRRVLHESIECLVAALEAKDYYTSGHSSRVADMTFDLARELGIRGYELEDLHIAAHLHDIGKIGVPDSVLNKKGQLLPGEWAQIQEHPGIGYNILNKSDELKQIAIIVLHHHEKWNGKGYPAGLKEAEIPLGSRIIAVCDTIDAMTSNRSYRNAFSWETCREEIFNNKGIQFDPEVVEATQDLWTRWKHTHSGRKGTNLRLVE